MGIELLFRNKPRCLTKDGTQCSSIDFPMFWNRQGLMTGGSGPTELDVASPLGMYGKTKLSEDPNNFIAGEPSA
jgi:hypothetical protein